MSRRWIGPSRMGWILGMVMVFGFQGLGWTASAPAVPNFTLTDLSKKKVSLADFRGKVVILNFFATWCPPCRAEIPELIEIYNDKMDKGLVILGVSLDMDSPQQVLTQFVKKMKIPYPVLMGTMTIAERFQIGGVPTTIIINKEGKLHKRYDGLVPASHFINEISKLL